MLKEVYESSIHSLKSCHTPSAQEGTKSLARKTDMDLRGTMKEFPFTTTSLSSLKEAFFLNSKLYH